jgi:hypothetical protein
MQGGKEADRGRAGTTTPARKRKFMLARRN